jgi:lipoprotein-anchoring transpeptidase ErfK/SrfK
VQPIFSGAFYARPHTLILAGLLTGLISTAAFLAAAGPASAQQGFGNFFGYQTQKHSKRRAVRRRASPPERKAADAVANDKKPEAAGPVQPVYAIVSLGDQHISVYDSNGRIARSRVSTGMRGHATPRGVFAVIGKERWHRSNIYSGAPMPWMQRITWSGVALHAGVVPGYPASHGCIRLPASFAPQFYKMTRMNARVVVAPRDTEPHPIAHDFLPRPRMYMAPTAALTRQAAAEAAPAPAPIELASAREPQSAALTTAAVPDAAAASSKPLDPISYAKALKVQARADKATAEKAAKAALEAAQAAGAEARQAVDDVEKAEAGAKAAQAKVAAIEAPPAIDAKSAPAPGTPEAAKAAEALATATTAAKSELVAARAALDEARRREAEKTPAAFAAVEKWKAAEAASEAASDRLSEAGRRIEPVSVFISKKEGRVFIRQDWKDVYEAPVSFRDPDDPIGTHVYIAVGAEPDGSALRWTSITVPEQAAPSQDKGKHAAKAVAAAVVLPQQKPDSANSASGSTVASSPAAAALDRIELPPDARKQIADLLWTGASLIVSDHARSDEMDSDTDFIVLTR